MFSAYNPFKTFFRAIQKNSQKNPTLTKTVQMFKQIFISQSHHSHYQHILQALIYPGKIESGTFPSSLQIITAVSLITISISENSQKFPQKNIKTLCQSSTIALYVPTVTIKLIRNGFWRVFRDKKSKLITNQLSNLKDVSKSCHNR